MRNSRRCCRASSAGDPPSRASVAIPSTKAREFLAKLSRTKRNIWDRSRPDVQQWIQQFMYLGFDEQVGELWIRRVQKAVGESGERSL